MLSPLSYYTYSVAAKSTTLPLNNRHIRRVQISTLIGQTVPCRVIPEADGFLLSPYNKDSSAGVSALMSTAPFLPPDHETVDPYLTPSPAGPLWTSDPSSGL